MKRCRDEMKVLSLTAVGKFEAIGGSCRFKVCSQLPAVTAREEQLVSEDKATIDRVAEAA